MDTHTPRAAVYLRQSLDRTGDGLAVDRQREDCVRRCTERGWEPVEYVDNSVSAKSANARPAFAQMLEDVAAGRVVAVVSWALDRLTRNARDRLALIETCQRARVPVCLIRGSDLDMATPSGRLVAGVLGEVAQAEIDTKGDRQRAAAAQRAQRGLPWGPRRPFGFMADKITHEPAEAARLAQAYRDVLDGRPIAQVAAQWNADGVTTTEGNRWTGPLLSALLTNPRNAGLRAYRGEIQPEPACWEPIVDASLWQAVSGLMSDPSRFTGGGGTAAHLLTGLGRCGICGTTVRKGQRPRDGVAFYRCSGSHHLSRTLSRVDAIAEAVVVERLSRADAPDLLVTSAPDVEALRTVRADVAERLNAANVAMAEGALDPGAWRTMTDRLRERMAAVEADLADSTRAPLLADLVNADDVAASWAATPLHRRRAVLDLLAEWYVMPTKGADVPNDVHVIDGLVGVRWR